MYPAQNWVISVPKQKRNTQIHLKTCKEKWRKRKQNRGLTEYFYLTSFFIKWQEEYFFTTVMKWANLGGRKQTVNEQCFDCNPLRPAEPESLRCHGAAGV